MGHSADKCDLDPNYKTVVTTSYNKEAFNLETMRLMRLEHLQSKAKNQDRLAYFGKFVKEFL